MYYDYLNLSLAWILMVLILLLVIIYPLRLCNRYKQLSSFKFFLKANKILRKVHKELGILAIIFTFLHCRISSQKLGINTGTICLLLLMFLWCSYLLRKQLKKQWIILHRFLTVCLVITLIAHILITRFTNINF